MSVQGAVHFLASPTAGTPRLGAFIPLEQIADVCERQSVALSCRHEWSHVSLSSCSSFSVHFSLSLMLFRYAGVVEF